MNRILQADVILTLTLEQASRLAALLGYVNRSRSCVPDQQYREIVALVREQCSKQGVRL